MKSEDLKQLATEFGCPLYVYDAEKIASQYNRLINAFSKVEKFKVHYAVKALSNVSVLKNLKSLGSALDTVSLQEVQLGLFVGFEPSEIIYTPNGVSMEEIEIVADLGVQINIDNLSILSNLKKLEILNLSNLNIQEPKKIVADSMSILQILRWIFLKLKIKILNL